MTGQVKNREGSARVWKYVVGLAGAAALGLLAYFSLTTVYSSDDYWYSTFWDQGLAHYLELMEYHYLEFNGRVLVHLLAHGILAFGNWAFLIVLCGLCLLTPLAGGWALKLDRERTGVLTVLFLTGVLVMPLAVFNQGMTWISAFCNYMFPTALFCVLAAALERERGGIWLYVLAFLCGATTEQMGLVSLALAALFAIDAVVRKKGFWRCLGCGIAAAVGVVTLFLSPATGDRAEARIHMDTLEDIILYFGKAFQREIALITDGWTMVGLMLALLCLTGLLLWRQAGRKWPLPVCAAGVAALLWGCFSTEKIQMAAFAAVFAVMLILGFGLMAYGHRFEGTVMICAVASLVVMLPTNTVEPRVMLPYYVLIVVCVSVLAAQLYREYRRAAVCAAVLVIAAAVTLVPVIRGYWWNYQIDQRNLDFAEADMDTGMIRYCTDYDLDYTWIKADFDPYFRNRYLDSVGAPENTSVYFFTSADAPVLIYCDGERLTQVALIGENGEVLLPLRSILEHFGAEIGWSAEQTLIELGDVVYTLEIGQEHSVIQWENETVTGLCRNQEGAVYCELQVFEAAFGLHIRQDEESGSYLITCE